MKYLEFIMNIYNDNDTNKTLTEKYDQIHFNLGIGIILIGLLFVACILPIIIAFIFNKCGYSCGDTIKSTEKIPLRRVSINE